MRLSLKELQSGSLRAKGYSLPVQDIEKARENTLNAPIWLHFGAGNIFRIFPALMQQKLLDSGEADKGIIVCENFDEELIEKVFEPYDNLTLGVTLKADGSMDKSVIASVAESIAVSKSVDALTKYFECESLQMVSFTITEKGYADRRDNGLMALITEMLYKRWKKGALPLSMVSMDNCSHNGDKLRGAVTELAEARIKTGTMDVGFMDYLNDPRQAAFPLTMIDKITPRPSDDVKAVLESDGFEGVEIIKTDKNTFAACFVNAEETGYLVIEDLFPNGRPKLEKAGAIFTDRETVDKVEKMKVCTCLNPLHTVLAVFGCLLGYESVSDEMKNPHLVGLIKNIGYIEGLPVVIDPKIINPRQFIDEVIEKRLPNPFVPDTPQRIACDSSQKIPVRFGETLKAYAAKGEDVSRLKYIPFFFAGWLRYLMGVNDAGEPFEISPDPMLNDLLPHMEGIKLGDSDYAAKLKPIISNRDIFGVDLYNHGLGEKVEVYFGELIQCKGAVAAALEKYSE